MVDANIPNCMRFTPGWFPLFSIFMIRSSRISAVNEGFWQEIKGTQGRKQQRRKAAKLLETTSLEAEGISIHPCKYWFLSLLLFPSMLQNKPRSPTTTTKHLTIPLSGTGPVVSWVGFYKSSTPKSWCDSLTLHYSLQRPLHSTLYRPHRFKKVFLSKSNSGAEEDCLALGCTNHPECCTFNCVWLLCISKDL